MLETPVPGYAASAGDRGMEPGGVMSRSEQRGGWWARARGLLILLGIGFGTVRAGEPVPSPVRDPLSTFELPDDWQDRFWKTPGVMEMLDLDPKALAERVPVQAGFRHCRCPSCDASEADNPLEWAPETPDVVTCTFCGEKFPNDKVPAKVKDAVPEDVIEVRPGTRHHYPYHNVEVESQRYPDERLYLHAKRDYEAREFLAKLALYAAIRYRDAPPDQKDPRLLRVAAVLILRFAQVYPNYATHFDQPGQPKFLQQADLAPPYRRGYTTGKWDWLGCLDVPINLVVAYALIRDSPALIEAGQALGDPEPTRTHRARPVRGLGRVRPRAVGRVLRALALRLPGPARRRSVAR